MNGKRKITVPRQRGRRLQNGSIMTEYVIVSLFVAMMMWATVVGVDYESPSGDQAGGSPSVLDAMEVEYQSYADVMAEQ